jgi:uncharacterized membrane protein YcfT
MVVMMHSTLGVQEATGEPSWMGALVAFAKPFRMPDFFLISGLFLARVIDWPWRRYLDTKVVHFAYFYVLWVTIQFVVKAHHFTEDGLASLLEAYALSYVQPFSTLWFIYLLPIFFVVSKLTRGISPLIVWPLTAALQIANVQTGSIVIDEFCARFVYFYSGYVFADFFPLRGHGAAPSARSGCAAGPLRDLRSCGRLQRRVQPTGRQSGAGLPTRAP